MEGFKIVEEGKHHLVLSHPLGHAIKIAKGALSPKKLEDIRRMCTGGMMAEGGDVEESSEDAQDNSTDSVQNAETESEPMPQAPAEQSAQPEININVGQPQKESPQPEVARGVSPFAQRKDEPAAPTAPEPPLAYRAGQSLSDEIGNTVNPYVQFAGKALGQVGQFGKGLLGIQEPDEAQTAAQGAPSPHGNMPLPGQERQPAQGGQPGQPGTPSGAPPGGNIPYSQLPQGAREYLSGINNQMKAEQGFADQEAQIRHQGNIDFQAQEAQAQTHLQHIMADSDKISQEIATAQIKPQSMWEGKDTFGKIRTAIGLLLGGIGGGLTHQENPVLKMLQKQIDDDVKAQKANLNNKHTLLAHYTREYGNEVQGMDRYRIAHWSAINGQIAEAAAKSGSPMAAARAQQLRGQIYMQYIEPAARRIAAMGMASQASGNGNYVPSASVLPEDASKIDERRVNLPTGGWTLAPTPKIAEKVNEANSDLASINDSIQELQKTARNNPVGIHVPFSEGRSKYQAIRASLVTSLNSLLASKRLMDSEIRYFNQRLPSEREWFTPAGQSKLNEAMRYLNSAYENRLRTELGLRNAPSLSKKPIAAGSGYKQLGLMR